MELCWEKVVSEVLVGSFCVFLFLSDIICQSLKLQYNKTDAYFPTMSDNNMKFARGGAELTIELLDKLNAARNKENVLISPLSIQTCMALAFTGAQGDTANEIAKVMKFVSNSPEEVADSFHHVLTNYEDSKLVKMANKVYVQEGHAIKPEYAAVTKQKFHAAAESINFAENVAAANKINKWVEEKTAGKISDLIPAHALDADTRLILLNALHFKGEWQEKFDPEDTKEDDFWLNETESTKVQFMRKQSEFRFGYLPDYECEALEIPYKDSDLSMFVLLPMKRDGLKAMADKLKGVNLLDLDKQLRTMNDMIVKFPKFKIEYSIELSKVMQEVSVFLTKWCGGTRYNILSCCLQSYRLLLLLTATPLSLFVVSL